MTAGLTTAYEQTQSATTLALVAFFYLVPMLVISPVAGALVDRFDRKRMMMVSDLAPDHHQRLSWCCYTGRAAHLASLHRCHGGRHFPIDPMAGLFSSHHYINPQEHYGREWSASLAEVGPGVLAPLPAGALLE
jgi:hypothetical protein